MLQSSPASEARVEIIDGDPSSGVLLLCDHASNAMPAEYGDLGMPASELERHIAYDIGAAEMTRAMAQALNAPAVLTTFSRLLIDPNRGRDDPTLVMRLSDGAIVPGNARVDDDEVMRRIRRFYDPYDREIIAMLDRFEAAGIVPAIVSNHSFTPVWKGAPRPWHVGLLWDADPRLAVPCIEALRRESDLVVGDNEPYDGALAGDTIDRHATARGLANLLTEVRQDLIVDAVSARAWGVRLASVLKPLLAAPDVHEVKFYRSRVATRHRRPDADSDCAAPAQKELTT
ncbi:N-formylglutamate amidohydrolase [Terrarubrum flagellatum]|uniref:N-formylglutamate amidohydrolase n=1 Tax=Terrirubrum flagellatum TaxID=2895980 RepID=UPI00314557F0